MNNILNVPGSRLILPIATVSSLTGVRSIIQYSVSFRKQKRFAEKSTESIAKSGRFKKPIVTEIRPFGVFYKAEEYHQHCNKKNSVGYKVYRFNLGHYQFLKKACDY